MTSSRILLSFAVILLLALVAGCSPQTGGSDTDGGRTQLIAAPINDSLMAENQRLREQINALAAENRSLNLRLEQSQGATTSGTGRNESRNTSPASPMNEPIKPTSYAPPSPLSAENLRPEYDAAVSLVKGKSYKEAIPKLENLLVSTVGTDLNDNCHYWLGEAYFGLKKFDFAADEFQAVVNFPGSDMVNDARLMLGSTYAASGRTEDAKKEYNDVIRFAPKTSFAKTAKARLDHMK